ncbi:hypothetical protein PRIPAC_74686 [Pristionchus pacificus]|uniref:Uncharacterized protein n=1 Tax=Pristionchus pacificus TaxID=54126 RepID=A0A2A6CRQ2_PRIPA|nr:hypothetical protein PRIPAC_74686 [Pristionchus pacificus]|eukprot:PDM80778.1 hypothetical protein PRIPAC_35781 [Pristionchus pacificus]
MIATSVLLLLLWTGLVESSSCLYCASPLLVTVHPSKFDINSDRTSESDSKCIRNITKAYNPAGCNGACLTMNLTREGETDPIGVLRDCLDSHKRVKARLEKKMGGASTQYTATYCACVGRHCNADGTPLGAMMNEEEIVAEARRGGVGRRGYLSQPLVSEWCVGRRAIALARIRRPADRTQVVRITVV